MTAQILLLALGLGGSIFSVLFGKPWLTLASVAAVLLLALAP
jgi:hypothetical protein